VTGARIASGSDADVYAIDDTHVLRRYRRRPVLDSEVAIMRYVRDRGYPAPQVFDVTGPDLILERVLGPLPHQGPLPLARRCSLTCGAPRGGRARTR
jgi:phosphotransferase family enzyme